MSELALLAMLPHEPDPSLRLDLAMGLCDLYSIESMEVVKVVIAEDCWPDVVDLMEAAYTNAVVNGWHDPDMANWRKAVQEMDNRSVDATEERD